MRSNWHSLSTEMTGSWIQTNKILTVYVVFILGKFVHILMKPLKMLTAFFYWTQPCYIRVWSPLICPYLASWTPPNFHQLMTIQLNTAGGRHEGLNMCMSSWHLIVSSLLTIYMNIGRFQIPRSLVTPKSTTMFTLVKHQSDCPKQLTPFKNRRRKDPSLKRTSVWPL